jgi:hypothetical protein
LALLALMALPSPPVTPPAVRPAACLSWAGKKPLLRPHANLGVEGVIL